MIVKLIMNYEQLLEIRRDLDLVIFLVETTDVPMGEVATAHVKPTATQAHFDEAHCTHKVRLRCNNLGKLVLQEV